jgi:hypothetical protein
MQILRVLGVCGVLAQLSCAAVPKAADKPSAGVGVGTATVTNATRTTLCAEEDNVYFKLAGEGLSGMRIEARQPSYISQLTVDDSKADFTDCHFKQSENPVYHFQPKQVVLWENERYVMLGNTYETFWRPDEVDVVVAGRVTQQVHLIQLHLKDASEPSAGRFEFLVLYPVDGYWRAKPIPSLPMTASTYGTSFLVGPVREALRPVVELSKVEFLPDQLSFQLSYEDGSHGTMHIAEISRDKLALEYAHDRGYASSQPMAAIRSMFVTPEKADVAEVSLRPAPSGELLTQPLSAVQERAVTEVRFGRSVLSKHNPSAPDMWFGAFAHRPL